VVIEKCIILNAYQRLRRVQYLCLPDTTVNEMQHFTPFFKNYLNGTNSSFQHAMSRKRVFESVGEGDEKEIDNSMRDINNWKILRASTDLSTIEETLVLVNQNDKSKKVRLKSDGVLVSRVKIMTGQYVCSFLGERQNTIAHCPFDPTFQCHAQVFTLFDGTVLVGTSMCNDMGCFTGLGQESFNCAFAEENLSGRKFGQTFLYCVNNIKPGDKIVCKGVSLPLEIMRSDIFIQSVCLFFISHSLVKPHQQSCQTIISSKFVKN
jgi:hypothetical protein